MKKLKIEIKIKNFSKAPRTEQDEMFKWLKELISSLKKHRKSLSPSFIGLWDEDMD